MFHGSWKFFIQITGTLQWCHQIIHNVKSWVSRDIHLEPEVSGEIFIWSLRNLLRGSIFTMCITWCHLYNILYSLSSGPGSREHVIARCLPGMYKIRMLLTWYIITYVWHKSKAWIDLCSFGAEMSLQLNFHIRQISSLFLAHLRADGCIPVRTPPVLGTSQTAAVVACILRTSAVL